MLTSRPKIFYGRESELVHFMETLSKWPARIAILGGGGMGKTSLARAVRHHPDIAAKYEHRCQCRICDHCGQLAALIGLYVGLNPGQELTKAVVQYFSR
jgi:hypothetical protein